VPLDHSGVWRCHGPDQQRELAEFACHLITLAYGDVTSRQISFGTLLATATREVGGGSARGNFRNRHPQSAMLAGVVGIASASSTWPRVSQLPESRVNIASGVSRA
jgi:hypothetical protein